MRAVAANWGLLNLIMEHSYLDLKDALMLNNNINHCMHAILFFSLQ